MKPTEKRHRVDAPRSTDCTPLRAPLRAPLHALLHAPLLAPLRALLHAPLRALIVVLLLGGNAGFAQAPADPDPWLGPDKALHFAFSAGIAGGGYAGATFFTDDIGVRLLVGGGLSLGAGAAKELVDLAGFGHPSWRDFAWDVVGAATGLLIAWLIDHLVTTWHSPGPARVTQSLSHAPPLNAEVAYCRQHFAHFR